MVSMVHKSEAPSLLLLLLLGSFAASSAGGRRMLQKGMPNAAAAGLGEGFWSVSGTNFVDANGNIVKFSGVNWSGFETPRGVVGGLEKRPYGEHLDQMVSLGFNMIRLPFAGETLLQTSAPWAGSTAANPDLEGLLCIQVMDKIIAACGQRGIKVILDYHRIHQTWDNEGGLWFDATTPESVWLSNWAALARRYQGNPTVIGADLFNELHHTDAMPAGAPLWVADAGALEPFNYRSATIRAIGAIHAVEPNWIIFMEGMWNGPYWWGGNCAQLLAAPIAEPANKLAYSAHDYGPYVANVTWFQAPEFPFNLQPLYSSKWGLIVEKGIGPLWVGEFGSFFPVANSDYNIRERAVFQEQIAYIGKLGASWTIAFWGPDTKDTGSILQADWNTVHLEKMALLAPIMHPNFV